MTKEFRWELKAPTNFPTNQDIIWRTEINDNIMRNIFTYLYRTYDMRLGEKGTFFNINQSIYIYIHNLWLVPAAANINIYIILGVHVYIYIHMYIERYQTWQYHTYLKCLSCKMYSMQCPHIFIHIIYVLPFGNLI